MNIDEWKDKQTRGIWEHLKPETKIKVFMGIEGKEIKDSYVIESSKVKQFMIKERISPEVLIKLIKKKKIIETGTTLTIRRI